MQYLFKNGILIYLTYNFWYNISEVCFLACVPSLNFCICLTSEDSIFFFKIKYAITNIANNAPTPAKKYLNILLCSILRFTSILRLNINYL